MENKIHVPNHQSESIPFYNEYPCSISAAACQFRSPESHRLIVLQRVRVACRVHQGLRRHQRWQHPNERLFGFVTCSRASWAGDLTMISGLTQGNHEATGQRVVFVAGHGFRKLTWQHQSEGQILVGFLSWPAKIWSPQVGENTSQLRLGSCRSPSPVGICGVGVLTLGS